MIKLVTFTFAAMLLTSLPTLDGAGTGTKPNILVIVGDDMGYADVGIHGCKDIPTPNIDALAASGVRFTNGYVSGPYPCPSPVRLPLLGRKDEERKEARVGKNPNATRATTGKDRGRQAAVVAAVYGRVRRRPDYFRRLPRASDG
jgi:hypothetical protein